MPRGKKQSGRPSAGGIKRNDYHRRNRKRHISMYSHSHGYQTGIRKSLHSDEVSVTGVERSILERRAVRDWKKYNPSSQYEPEQLDTICLGYIRHRLTNYDRLATGLYGEAVRQLKTRLFRSIAAVYPWLAEKCETTLAHQLTRPNIRVVKRRTLTQLQIDEHNDRENARFYERLDGDDWKDEVNLDGALSSLASSRLLFSPPFLPRDEIRQRRFGGQTWMNDNWWEWEQEKALIAPEREKRFRWAT